MSGREYSSRNDYDYQDPFHSDNVSDSLNVRENHISDQSQLSETSQSKYNAF